MAEFIHTHWIELTGASLGLLYLYFEYKADIKIWASGILMSLFYVYVYIENDFYAFATINVYYIIAQIYGWIKWRRKTAMPYTVKIYRSAVGYNGFVVYLSRTHFVKNGRKRGCVGR